MTRIDFLVQLCLFCMDDLQCNCFLLFSVSLVFVDRLEKVIKNQNGETSDTALHKRRVEMIFESKVEK